MKLNQVDIEWIEDALRATPHGRSFSGSRTIG